MAPRALVLIAVLVVGCSSGTAPAATSTPPRGASLPSLTVSASSSSEAAASDQSGDGSGASLRPSGAKIRVVNLYSGGVTAPKPVDVYGNYTAVGAPLVSVPYGTATDWFDPGILDDQRNAEITFFPAGRHATGDLLIDQSETLKGTERITMVLSDGDNKKADGTNYGQLQVTFDHSSLNPLPSPLPGESLAVVDVLALKQWPGIGGTDYLYLSAGTGCLKAVESVGDSSIGVQPLSPGRGGARFSIPSPGKLSLHASDTCTDTSPFPDIVVSTPAGQKSLVVLYSPDDKELRSLIVPLDS